MYTPKGHKIRMKGTYKRKKVFVRRYKDEITSIKLSETVPEKMGYTKSPFKRLKLIKSIKVEYKFYCFNLNSNAFLQYGLS